MDEVVNMRGTSRREVGHGALAERSLVPVLPPKEKFPYVMRIVADPGAGMAEVIAGADLAITAGGTTMWELSAMGVPFIAVIVAENQRLSTLANPASAAPDVMVEDMMMSKPPSAASTARSPLSI